MTGETGRSRGKSGREFDWLAVEPWVPAGEVVVEDAGADLEEEVGAAWRPAHLLFLDHAAADDVVDGGFGGGAGDGFAAAVAFAVVGDLLAVACDVAAELDDPREERALPVVGLVGAEEFEVVDEVGQQVEGAEGCCRATGSA
ncbi:hypothetical protein AB0F17_63250 [Nonomuraea sp. NPDC026600]|uniref:hypothetical protein n=1 Tax=Nonomuraea sp. NPDC026600 TaxID=3155363 RepID=UPI0033EBA18B